MAIQLPDKLNIINYQSACSKLACLRKPGTAGDGTIATRLNPTAWQMELGKHRRTSQSGRAKMRSLIVKTALAVLCVSAQLPAAFAGPQDPQGKFEDARPSVERPAHVHDRMTGQTKPGPASTEANSLPAFLATLRKLHDTDGHIEPQN